jgi:3-hydroxyisobutyrate dehydrogenase
MRTIVLRKAFPLSKELRFHTDIRSNKWQELQNNDTISSLFYDASTRVQIRVKGRAILHFIDEMTSEAWGKTTLSSRRCYLTEASPSSFSAIPTSGLSEKIEQENFTLEESEAGAKYFGIVSIQVESLEWLWLNHAGHRRAFFDYLNDSYKWMIP